MVHLRLLKRKIKDHFGKKARCKERGVKGYCLYDLWDLDMYLSELLPKMITEFADTTQAYPTEFQKRYGDKGFDLWLKYLYEMAYWFNEASIDSMDDNLWGDLFFEKCEQARHFEQSGIALDEEFLEEKEKLFKNYCIEAHRIDLYKKACIKKAFDMLCEHFYDLWW